MVRPALLTVLLILLGAPAAGQDTPAVLLPRETARVASVPDGAHVSLADGRLVELADVNVPDPKARTFLLRLVGRRRLDLLSASTPIPVDRHGALQAHLRTSTGVWVQGALLEAGLARVSPGAGGSGVEGPATAQAMLTLEATARAARRGIWANPAFRVRTPAELADDLDTFQLMEGRVVTAALVGGRAYLNFGPDRTTDTTVIADPPVARGLAAAGVIPAQLAGRLVRVRGWVGRRQGPEIRLASPEALEILD